MHLIITEKHNTAKRIAQILSDGNAKQKKVNGVNTYEYPESRVIGLSGHILNVDFPLEYNNWSDVEPQELIGAKIVLVPTQKKIISALQKLAKLCRLNTSCTRVGVMNLACWTTISRSS